MSFGDGKSIGINDEGLSRNKIVFSEQDKAACRKTVCAFATDAAEAIEFMKMLGVHPSQNDSEIDGSDFLPYHEVAANSTPPRTRPS